MEWPIKIYCKEQTQTQMIISIEDQTVAEINQTQYKHAHTNASKVVYRLYCTYCAMIVDHAMGELHKCILCAIKRDARFVENNVNEFIGIIKSMWRCVRCVLLLPLPLPLLWDFSNRSMCAVSSVSSFCPFILCVLVPFLSLFCVLYAL